MRMLFDRRGWLPLAIAVAVGTGVLAHALPVFAQVSTPTGTNVQVTIGSEAQITFPEVLVAGETSIYRDDNFASNAPPSNLTPRH